MRSVYVSIASDLIKQRFGKCCQLDFFLGREDARPRNFDIYFGALGGSMHNAFSLSVSSFSFSLPCAMLSPSFVTQCTGIQSPYKNFKEPKKLEENQQNPSQKLFRVPSFSVKAFERGMLQDLRFLVVFH